MAPRVAAFLAAVSACTPHAPETAADCIAENPGEVDTQNPDVSLTQADCLTDGQPAPICDPLTWITASAAQCIADIDEAHPLPEGASVTVSPAYLAEAQACAWVVSALTATATQRWSIETRDGTVLGFLEEPL